jgi:hypothetical protein
VRTRLSGSREIYAAAGAVLRREPSSCSLMPVSNQNDLAS